MASHRSSTHLGSRVWLVPAAAILCFASPSAFASSAVIGSVAGSRNATLSGQRVESSSVVFSGDTLKVDDGLAILATASGSRMTFGRDTAASFARTGNEVAVLLQQGEVTFYHPDVGNMLVKMEDISVIPAKGFNTLGEIAMLDGSILVNTKRGKLRVEGTGVPVEVPEGKSITLTTKTARSPHGASVGSGHSTVFYVAIGATGAAAILAGVAIAKSNDATNAQDRATAAEQQAAAAQSTAAVAESAAAAANSAAAVAAQLANTEGCLLNSIENSLGKPSPYAPSSGYSCP